MARDGESCWKKLPEYIVVFGVDERTPWVEYVHPSGVDFSAFGKSPAAKHDETHEADQNSREPAFESRLYREPLIAIASVLYLWCVQSPQSVVL